MTELKNLLSNTEVDKLETIEFIADEFIEKIIDLSNFIVTCRNLNEIKDNFQIMLE